MAQPEVIEVSGNDLPKAAVRLWKRYSRATLLREARAALGATSTERARRPSSPEAQPRERGIVLLVEDEAAMRVATQRVLTGSGHEVVVADSIAAARDALVGDRDYVAVLCDLGLRDGSGLELVHWLREHRSALASRTVVVTGGATDEASRKLLLDGGFEVLRKPVGPDRLLEHFVAHPGSDRPLQERGSQLENLAEAARNLRQAADGGARYLARVEALADELAVGK